MGNSENYFKHADKFLPERWLKSESKSEIYAKNSHPFVTLPFGFGPRMCLGRRFAELELEILLAKVNALIFRYALDVLLINNKLIIYIFRFFEILKLNIITGT